MPKKKNNSDSGTAIQIEKNRLVVPNNPVIPFIKGDGTGPDIWNASVRVFDAAVSKLIGTKSAFIGRKSLRVNLPLRSMVNGFPKIPSIPLKNIK